MRGSSRYSFDLEDGFEGAVDVVFLLIIFFLVASSFDKTVREKLALPTRDPDKAVATSPQTRERLDITIYHDSRIALDHKEIDVGDPNSVEAYRLVGDAIEGWLAEHKPGLPLEKALEGVDVFVTTDKESYAGATLNVIMACLDRGVTPQVIFEEARVASR
ncbi:MAG: biopolymer transporter ExbD [Acidobacteriota bacterium]|nr:biopolymer transporter ExbD [Acidobacteriota bacterium]MDQ7088996.1 biopolymer transporter ExbD [Acidobacteriota bacterium]